MYAGKYMNQYGGREAGGLGQVGLLEAWKGRSTGGLGQVGLLEA